MPVRDMDSLGVAITGAAGDIGSAMGRELAARGACITAIDTKDAESAAPWIDSIKACGDVTYVRADIRDRPTIAATLGDVENLYAVVCNAAIIASAPFLEITPEMWSQTIDVNLTGSFTVAQVAAQELVARGRAGRIVFTGSWVGEVPWPDITPYAVSKAAVRMLARQMALELSSHRILVNVVAPGIVDAGLAKHQKETDPSYAERITHVIPLGQLQTSEQVARVAAFLCAPDNDYMTGSVVLVDGGCSLYKFD